MTGNEEKTGGHGIRVCAGLVVFLMLVLSYFFSGVPVLLGFMNSSGRVPKPVRAFYAPVSWLYMNSKVVRTVLDAQSKALGGPPQSE